MKTGELIGEIVSFEEGPKEVYVEVFTRNQHGEVVNKKVYPVSNAYAHHVNKVVLKCEEDIKEV